MRSRLVLAGLLAAAAALPAYAQPKKPPAAAKPAPAETVAYISLYGDLLGPLTADAVLKETRQAGKVVAAELDVCHPQSATSRRNDRFVVALKPDGARLVGTATSQEQKVPVSVNLVRKVTGKTLAFQGTITRGDSKTDVDMTDLSDQTEAQFLEMQPATVEIFTEPAVFGVVSPIDLAARVTRAGLPGLLEALRAENVKLLYFSLFEGCDVLRTGHQVVQFEAAFDRTAALVAKLRALPGVTATGWTSSGLIDWAVRIPADTWRNASGGLDRDRLGGRVAEIAAGVIGAKSHTMAWDAITGELTVTLKRPSDVAPSLGLTDTIALQLLIGPELPSGGDRAILWIESYKISTADEGSGSRVALLGAEASEFEDGGAPVDSDALLDGLASGLNGQRWNTEQADWK